MLLNDFESTEQIKNEILKFLKTNYNKNTILQNLQNTANMVARERFTATDSHKKKRIINKQSNVVSQGTGKTRTS